MAPSLPILNSSFKRDRVTMAQINEFENAAMNGLRADRRAFSANFRELLAGRRARPVAKDTAKILAALQGNQTIVVASPTGSGKTTEIPQLAMFNELGSKFLVGCTQPRRLAATSVAEFVAKQRDVQLGEEVGYKVRFDNKTVPHKTRLQYMTDGMLLQEIQTDQALSKYGCIIIDEAHERSISTDILLPLLRVALARRKDLKLIIMSATIDAQKFRKFFAAPDGKPAPYIDVGGASYPVQIFYAETIASISNFIEATIWTVVDYHMSHPLKGDILAFLPGEDDIGQVAKGLVERCPDDLEVIPVFSLLSDQQQQAVFKTVEGKRKVVLATNIAETSLTIDGILCVIDCGRSKQTAFDPRYRAERLQTLPISKASAAQRAGRAGRTAPGECYRLYPERIYDLVMESSTIPEIKRSDLGEVALKLMAMGHGSVQAVWDFKFVDQPDPEVLYAAIKDLVAMGLVTEKGFVDKPLASAAVQFPIYPGWYQAIRKANELGCLNMMVSVAAIMSTQASIFTRSKSMRVAADKTHVNFYNPHSDLLYCYNAFEAYRQAVEEGQDPSRWCREKSINEKTVKEALQLEQQLIEICKRAGMGPSLANLTLEDPCINFCKAIAFGFCHRAAIMTDPSTGTYMQSHYQWESILSDDSCLIGERDVATGEVNRMFEWIVYTKCTQSATGRSHFESVTIIHADWLIDLPYFQEHNLDKLCEDARKMRRVTESLNRARARRASGEPW